MIARHLRDQLPPPVPSVYVSRTRLPRDILKRRVCRCGYPRISIARRSTNRLSSSRRYIAAPFRSGFSAGPGRTSGRDRRKTLRRERGPVDRMCATPPDSPASVNRDYRTTDREIYVAVTDPSSHPG